MNIAFYNLFPWLGRHWLWYTLLLLALIQALGPHTVDAQGTPTATPDVNTVPPIHLLITPTSPPPAPVVTATPILTSPGNNVPDRDGGATEGNGDTASNGDNRNGPADEAETTNRPGSGAGNPGEGTRESNKVEPLSNEQPVDGPHLTLEIQPNRAIIWQQQSLRLTITVRNSGNQPAMAVRLRSELPRSFDVIAVHSDTNAIYAADPTAGAEKLLAVGWPELAPGADKTVVLDLRIAPTTPNGVFIDTFAVAAAQNVADVVAGISIAMPPAQPPRF